MINQVFYLFSFTVDEGEFDQGVGCIIRANETSGISSSSLSVSVVDQLEASFQYGPSEELVSNIIRITPNEEGFELNVSSVYKCQVLPVYFSIEENRGISSYPEANLHHHPI